MADFPRISLLTWNLRSYARPPPSRARRLHHFLHSHILAHDVVMLQEMHGNTAEIESRFRLYHGSRWVFASQCLDPSFGGIVTMVSKRVLQGAVWRAEHAAPGRILRVMGEVGARRVELVNAHNEECGESLFSLFEEVQRSAGWVFFGGDFNADGNDEEEGQAGGLSHEKWVRGLHMVTEAFQTAPTYWHPSPESPGYTPMGRRLDRWFLNLAPEMLSSFACHAAVIQKVPKCSTGDPISDHRPLSLSASPRMEVPPTRRSIQEWLLREPEFALTTQNSKPSFGKPRA